MTNAGQDATENRQSGQNLDSVTFSCLAAFDRQSDPDLIALVVGKTRYCEEAVRAVLDAGCAAYRERIEGLLRANNSEVERRRAAERDRDEWMRRWMESIHTPAIEVTTFTTGGGCPHDTWSTTTAGMICSRCGKRLESAPAIYVAGEVK